MSEIEMYAKSTYETLESSQNNAPEAYNASMDLLKLQDGHRVFSPEEMLEIFQRLREQDDLESPATERPELQGQPWLDAEPNVPHSLRPRIPAPTPPAQETSPTIDAFGLSSAEPMARVDSQSLLFDRDAFGSSRYGQAQGSSGIISAAAGAASGVTSHPQQSQGGLASSFMRESSSTPLSAGGWGLPPGLQQRPTVSPDNIQWVYTDPNGMHQGPFAGPAMNQWFLSGWLKDDLQVKRLQDTEFVPIGVLKQKLKTDNPFTVWAPQETWDQAFSAMPQMPLQQQPIVQPSIPQLSQMQSASRSSTPFGGAWGSVWGSQTQLNSPSLSKSFSQQLSKSSASIPINDEKEFSGLLQQLSIQSDEEEDQEENFHEPAQSASPAAPIAAPISAPIGSPAASKRAPASVSETTHSSTSAPAPIAAPVATTPAPIAAPIGAQEPAQVTEEAPVPSDISYESQTIAAPVAEDLADQPSEVKQEDTSEAKEPEPAPWAQRPAPNRAVSLAEIQAREAKRKQELTKQQQQLAQQQAAAAAAALRASQPEVLRSTPLPSGPGGAWGARPVTTTPKRSVADIQREQALAQKSKAAVVTPKPLTAWAGSGFSEVTRPSAQISSPSPAHASVSANSAASPWQTVNRKAKAPTAAPASTPAPAPAPVAVKQREIMKPAVLTDELIQWCKITFKQSLSKDVDPDELLSLFLTLPGNQDGKSFIADSIYSYSATLDGRRFASEFIQRRKEAESSLKPGETWNDVLNRINPDAEVDPSFKVVTKKRYRQIPKPSIN